jgi:hypothetical protein
VKQEITSAATSTNMIPRLFKKVPFKPGSVNLDIGGGKYETATEYLHSLHVHNFVYDPFNRDISHNSKIYRMLVANSFADTATLSNVLNVIKPRQLRLDALEIASKAVGTRGICHITVYEGDRTGNGRRTTKGWQHHRKLKEYLSEAQLVFEHVGIKGGVISAHH